MYLFVFPCKLFLLLEPAYKEDTLNDLFESPPCDLDGDCSQKIAAAFGDKWQLSDSKVFFDSLRLARRKAKCDNMRVERLFREFRDAAATVGAQLPSAERVGATGLLSQLLHSHIARGGHDYRVQTGEDLVKKGVPLRRAKVPKQAARGNAAFLRSLASQSLLFDL